MNKPEGTRKLRDEHTSAAIAARIASATKHSYLGDFVLGAVDGTVTTFAIVAGASGAGLSSGVALVLGLANVVADGVSMAASNYLKTRSDHQVVDQIRRMEEMHIDHIPEGEREEIRQIFRGKGFDGSVLENIVDVITQDRRRWVDTMLTEEWGLQLVPPAPKRAAMATLTAFLLAGMIPLLPLLATIGRTVAWTFPASAILTAITFVGVGWMRGRVTARSPLAGSLETLLVGGAAAMLAFLVGHLLQSWAIG